MISSPDSNARREISTIRIIIRVIASSINVIRSRELYYVNCLFFEILLRFVSHCFLRCDFIGLSEVVRRRGVAKGTQNGMYAPVSGRQCVGLT